jgi:hypothetical protein
MKPFFNRLAMTGRRWGLSTDASLWVLDRIEDAKLAVLVSEAGDERTVAVAELPPGVREGDALRPSADGGNVRYRVDREATERLQQKAKDLRASLRRGPSGPISL